ncbi:hypothetical protein CYMTET_23821 [Cymbomonas tetramitiformis]|uniref:UFSP1/2/DUB catalytic domain-containing protein n=1 Tax=Cymbomonas tetramitiformis TaxID=36881 RepID=A0AAE0FXR1_9CHLO|nr:hypothetical protein CYMTET_23821 [Cymbomonas tetramitiformis]
MAEHTDALLESDVDGGLETRFVPEIGCLQVWLERAWQAGFDRDGAAHFGGKIAGSKKWIGATEVAALLRSFGLRARVVDFSTKSTAGEGAVTTLNT